MGTSYTGFQDVQRGNAADESGCNLKTITYRGYPQFKDYLVNFAGQNRTFAIPDKLSRDVTIEGEVITGDPEGIMACDLATAFVPTNEDNYFVAIPDGTNSGGLYPNEFNVTSSAEGWLFVSVPFHSDPLIA